MIMARRRDLTVAAACLAALGLLLPARAARAVPPPGGERPLTALVLSGGGARGMAHVGALRVLEELRVPFDLVVGTSMGAVVGALLATGLGPAEIEKELLAVDWDEIFTDRASGPEVPYREREAAALYHPGIEIGYDRGRLRFPGGIYSGQKLAREMVRLMWPSLGVLDFDRLAVPFIAVATDLETGRAAALRSGDLVRAVSASMAVPGVFAPVEIGGRLFVDGGLTANLPVEIARRAGARRIIAVDVSAPLAPRGELDSPLAVTRQVINIMGLAEAERQRALLGEGDILVRVGMPGFTATSFKAAPEIISSGSRAARLSAPSLEPLALEEDDFRARQARFAAWRRQFEPVFGIVEILPPGRLSEDFVRSRAGLSGHGVSSPGELASILDSLHGTGLFERVDLRLEDAPGREGVLRLEPRAKKWGPNFFYAGFGFGGDFGGNSDFNPRLRYRMTQVNPAGAELDLRARLGLDNSFQAEFYQPVGGRGPFFLAPLFRHASSRDDFYRDGVRHARYRTRYTGVGLDLGLKLGSRGEARVGGLLERADSRPSVGAAALPAFQREDFLVSASLAFDSLDRPFFPRSGSRLVIDYRGTAPGRGSEPLRLLSGQLSGFFSARALTLDASAGFFASPGSRLPEYRSYRLGGFNRLGGYRPGEVRGDCAVLLRLAGSAEISRPLPFGRESFFTGLSLEAGDAGDRFSDFSAAGLKRSLTLFLAFETAFGPFYLAYSARSLSSGRYYLHLGPVF